ncbi:type II secretion system major pseudopilin GspG [Candidatus Sumerlaeota bacterium]|nr:type II secretion system major pseudopilin GspG [Candidatus Sumerlaeota bacterium]
MPTRHRSLRGGFTFLEIMLVVAIVGILLSVVGIKMVGRAREAKETTTRLEMHNVESALEMYEMKAGDYPTTEEGLIALVRRPTGQSEWRQCLKAEPRDAWGSLYVYRCPGEDGREFDLVSCGRDRKTGTSDDIVFSYEDETAQPVRD